MGGEDETKRLQAIFRYLDPGGLDLKKRLSMMFSSVIVFPEVKEAFLWMNGEYWDNYGANL